ncbi:MAG: DNA helicase II [Gammaproteobacteria bacterium]|nr:DNA helicase II [Gammaproteobacteria bacterium]
MDFTKIIEPLNDAQRAAVTAPNRAMLVLAGAGSGKTRVLVHRIAWQIQVEGIPAHSILAVTFTNKAAREMRQRIEQLLNISTHTMWIGTFHGLAHRLLRRHANAAKLPDTFQVMDSADQLRVIKRIVAAMNLDEGRWPPKQIQWFINAQKDEGKRARHQLESGDFYLRQMLAVYKAYEETCDRTGLVDFAELLLRVHELMRDNPDLLDFYQRRFLQVHVDEFQDTNTIQYAWLRLLTEGKDNLFVVGDDDQSIYGWRGARIENIFNFQKHYKNHELIKLEQNYRSTGNILNAANKVISMNEARMGKELWTNAGDGEPISLYAAFNELDEAYFVVERIKAWVNEGGLRSEIAILYRSNAQSRQFEEKLMSTGTPYRVYGGLRFFERAEIKNALAYLRLMANRHDDASFERVINTPARGLGAKAIEDIRLLAKEQEVSLWQASALLVEQKAPSPRARTALAGFMDLIERLSQETGELELYQKVELVNEHSGLVYLYQTEKGDRGEEKLENLVELINAARLFDAEQENEENLSELDLFLAHAALEAGDMQGDDFDDCVQLMTLHSAKGLEFKLVFMVGMEEGLFPAQQSADDIIRLEEERRLCYVGMTRAMRQLYLTYAESRRIYGRENYPKSSRFIREIPPELIQEVRLRGSINRPGNPINTTGFKVQSHRFNLGQRVGHAKFGEGVVLQIEGEGAQERAQINFKQAGVKWLMLNYAQLEAL